MEKLKFKVIGQEELAQCAEIVSTAHNAVAEANGFEADQSLSPLLERLSEYMDSEKHQLFGAFSGITQVGFYALGELDEETFELKMFSIRPSCQQRGFGQQMLDHALTTILARKGVIVACTIFEGTDWLARWLLKNGFFVEASGTPEGLPHPILLMQKNMIASSAKADSSCDPASCEGCQSSCNKA